jgi:hypothetical protein
MKQNFPFFDFHALLLQFLRPGYSGKLDKGRAENFISTQEIQLLVCHRILHEFEKKKARIISLGVNTGKVIPSETWHSGNTRSKFQQKKILPSQMFFVLLLSSSVQITREYIF